MKRLICLLIIGCMLVWSGCETKEAMKSGIAKEEISGDEISEEISGDEISEEEMPEGRGTIEETAYEIQSNNKSMEETSEYRDQKIEEASAAYRIEEDYIEKEETQNNEEHIMADVNINQQIIPVYMDTAWEYAENTIISNEPAILYRAVNNRKNIIVGVDAGHGTTGAKGQKIYCHPDKSQKTTGGSTAAGAIMANAQSEGMVFNNGTAEAVVVLKVAQLFRDRLLEEGYDVLMLRDKDRIELDLLARTIIANNTAACHISLHYDGDGLDYDKGAFFISVPEGIKQMYPVNEMWEMHDALGRSLVAGLESAGVKIFNKGYMPVDLIQTSYSTVPSVDLELGNKFSDLSDESFAKIVEGLMAGIRLQYPLTEEKN